MGPKTAKDRLFVSALARGLQVLRCFTQSTPELGTAEIGRLLGLPQPTVWRLCYTLLKEGYLTQAGGKLRPAIPLLGLGYAAIAAQPIAELARADMQKVATRHQGAVSLGARDGLNMLFLQRCQGSSIILSELGVGSRVPIASSATGLAYLAGLSKPERAALLADLRGHYGRHWKTLSAKIKKALADYEKDGYVTTKALLYTHANAVAVPMRSSDGSVLLSLTSGGIREVYDDEKLPEVGADLKALAERLAPALLAKTAS